MSLYEEYYIRYREVVNQGMAKGDNLAIDKRLWTAMRFLEDKQIMPGEVDKLQSACEELEATNETEMLEIMLYFVQLLTKGE